MNAIFAERELRRYPLTAADRRFTRHLIGIVDPFWFLFLVLELGLPLGLYVRGRRQLLVRLASRCCCCSSPTTCWPAWSRSVVDRLMQRKGGAAVLMSAIMLLGILPSVAGAGAARRTPRWWPPS